MQKAKKYDWTDSNLALFGSDTEKQVKKESAESEPAWEGAGQEVGIQIWRINKFQVEHWPKEDNGDFYSGDSYIILRTYKNPDEDDLEYDLHFWIGKYSTQDEYGTAAYKTVELDTLLDDKPVQHREVGNHESALFKSYFPTLTIMKGGCDTGFKRVLPEEYKPRFFHVKKQAAKRITMTEVSLKKGNFSEDDVFILDTGNIIYQINGTNCSHDEKFEAAMQTSKFLGSRGKCKKLIVDGSPFENEDIAPFFVDKAKKEKVPVEFPGNKILKVVPGGAPELVGEGDAATRDLLNSDDAFIIDTENVVFAWIGRGASVDERRNAMSNASNYLNTTEYAFKPISVVSEGKEGSEFINASF